MIGWFLIGLCFWAFLAGLITGEGMLRVGGLAGAVLVYVVALALDWWWNRPKAKPLVEADPFTEIAHLDWDFPPLVHEEERRAA